MNTDRINLELHDAAEVDEADLADPLEVELFTHPICNGCQEALHELSILANRGLITLMVSSLSVATSRNRAEELGVTTVPTIRIGSRFEVLMHKSDLKRLVDELQNTSDNQTITLDGLS